MPTGEERAEAKRLWQVAKVIGGEMQTKDIGASAGVSYAVVSSRLRKLEAMGIVTRRSGLNNTSFWRVAGRFEVNQ